MYSYKITSFLPQLEQVIEEAQKHLGIFLIYFQTPLTITHYIYYNVFRSVLHL